MQELLNSPELAPVVDFYNRLGVLSIILSVISVVMTILIIVARWRIFSKAGEGGWKSLIPIYSDYITFKICWAGIAFWISVLLSILSSLFLFMAYPYDLLLQATTPEELVAFLQTPANTVFLIIGGVFSVIEIIWEIVKRYKTSKVFGHGFGFFLGLFFFPTIFTLILGFGSSEYVGIDD